MAVRNLACILKQTLKFSRCKQKNFQYAVLKYKSVATNTVLSQQMPVALNALPTSHQTVRVLFNNHKTADFKNIWGQLVELVKHFAYVKETQYGVTFDVVHEPDPHAHPAFSGLYLHHHTDMNYREKSPGMQLLHCLKATDPKTLGSDPGGMSFFVDGFRIARWLEENEPSAFHILTSTPVRFQIKTKGKRYSQLWPVIALNQDGDVNEIHYNNRTMGPLQAPSHIIVPFYHAYKLFTEKMRHPSSELKFHLLPGDLVAFNNRRVLHGRTGFDPTKVSRHLVGCYVDIDETFSLYDSLLSKTH